MRTKVLLAALALGITACGGGDQPAPQPPSEAEPAAPAPAPEAPAAPSLEFGMPDWMQVDNDAQTVTIQLVAGSTPDNNHWNFNGFYGGDGGITVPEGYTVTISFSNDDPAMAHSFGIQEPMDTYPNQFTEVTPVFEGALSDNPLSMTEATMPGESEDHTFVAEEEGDYVIVCYVTGHAATGMILDFTVSEDGTAGALIPAM